MGHSRGTLSGLAAAAGSEAWDVDPDPRVKAIMGMASGGTRPVTLQPNLTLVNVPSLLVAGDIDLNSMLSHNQALFNQIGCPVNAADPLNPPECTPPRVDKQLVTLPLAHHRSFISTFCDQTQATAAIAQLPDGQANPRKVFETNAVTNFLGNANSGRAIDYCSLSTFTTPVDVRPLVRTLTTPSFCITGETFPPIPGPCTVSGTVPTTGLGEQEINEEEEVKQNMAALAVEFFNAKLERDSDGDGVPDAADNCRDTANSGQADADGDGTGDACDSDRDGDGIANTTDNCADIANAGQADTDADGTGDACDPTPQGTTPPVIVVPEPITVDATGPDGATVTYSVTATDDIDGPTSVLCTPSAGSVFAIGNTVVGCDSTDAAGNTAHAAFLVTVLGAKEQLTQLIAKVIDATSLPAAVKTQLIQKLQSLNADFDPTNPKQRKAACLTLKAFTTLVRYAAPPATAAEWTADANRIRAVLAC